jgi:hypothetical protein
VAKCKRCGCLLPTDIEALEKHQEECNGSHFLATSRAMTHRMRARREGRGEDKKKSSSKKSSSKSSRHNRQRRGGGGGRRQRGGEDISDEDEDLNLEEEEEDDDEDDDNNDYTVMTPGDDLPDMLVPSGMKMTEETVRGEAGGIPWSVRLEKIGDDLRNAVTVVKVHRVGKRLLRKSLRGNEAITWLLGKRG